MTTPNTDGGVSPLYCIAGDDGQDCPCGATVSGKDPRHGVCRAIKDGPDPRIDPYGVSIVLIDRRVAQP